MYDLNVYKVFTSFSPQRSDPTCCSYQTINQSPALEPFEDIYNAFYSSEVDGQKHEACQATQTAAHTY